MAVLQLKIWSGLWSPHRRPSRIDLRRYARRYPVAWVVDGGVLIQSREGLIEFVITVHSRGNDNVLFVQRASSYTLAGSLAASHYSLRKRRQNRRAVPVRRKRA